MIPLPRQDDFHYRPTAKLVKTLDFVARDAGVSRPQAFEDFLTITVCTYRTGLKDLLSRVSGGEDVEDKEYRKTIEPYCKGKRGSRPIDALQRLFHEVQEQVAATDLDFLGDLFQGAITHGDNQQFFTPDPICDLMAKFAGPGGKTVFDPACGSGRMLIAAAKVNRDREFIGQDIDHRCAKITAINLAIRNLYGFAIWGDTLAVDDPAKSHRHVYRTGFDGTSWIRDVTLDAFRSRLAMLESEPARVIDEPETSETESTAPASPPTEESRPFAEPRPKGQLRLF